MHKVARGMSLPAMLGPMPTETWPLAVPRSDWICASAWRTCASIALACSASALP
jgi:hypothetical protein